MNPEDVVRALCARHGLPADAGDAYLPLVVKALAAPDDVRERLLKLVDGSLAERAAKKLDRQAVVEVDREVLVAVARVLHGWTPSDSMLDLGSTLRRFGRDNEAA